MGVDVFPGGGGGGGPPPPALSWGRVEVDHGVHVHARLVAGGTPHRKHLCNRCGRNFWARELTISNPLAVVLAVPGLAPSAPPVAATQDLRLELADYSAVAIWGSNQAIVWTAPTPEADGIHVHSR